MQSLFVVFSFFARIVGSTEPSRHQNNVKHLNVLMIVIDDLRADFLGAYNEREGAATLTQNLDSLAKRRGSTLFSKAYCQYALCSPSRMSFLTGVRPDTTRVYDLKQRLRAHLPKAVSIPQHFRENGYFTKGIGKIWHRGHVDELSWSVEQPWVDRPHYALPRNLDALKLRAQNMHESKNHRLKPQLGPLIEIDDTVGQRGDVYTDGAIALATVAALKEAKYHLTSEDSQKKGFFVAVGFMKPHLPWCVPKRYWDAVNVSTVPFLTDTVSSAPSKRSPPRAAPIPGNELATYHFNHQDLKSLKGIQKLRRAYAACVHYVDAQVGIVLSALNDLGLQESTAIVFLSDHGYKLGEHGSWTKGTNVEEDTRVPLLCHIPTRYVSEQRRLTHERSSSTLVSNSLAVLDESVVELVDLFPTLIDLCGLSPLPKGSQALEGNSLFSTSVEPFVLQENAERRLQTVSSGLQSQTRNEAHTRTEIPFALERDVDKRCGAAFSQILSGKFMGYSIRHSCLVGASRRRITGQRRSGHRLTLWIEFAARSLSVSTQKEIEKARVESLAKALLPSLPDSYTLSTSTFFDTVCNSHGIFSNGNLTRLGEIVGKLATQQEGSDRASGATNLDAIELYNLDSDPFEAVNVAGDMEHAHTLGILTCQWIKGWRGSFRNDRLI